MAKVSVAYPRTGEMVFQSERVQDALHNVVWTFNNLMYMDSNIIGIQVTKQPEVANESGHVWTVKVWYSDADVRS